MGLLKLVLFLIYGNSILFSIMAAPFFKYSHQQYIRILANTSLLSMRLCLILVLVYHLSMSDVDHLFIYLLQATQTLNTAGICKYCKTLEKLKCLEKLKADTSFIFVWNWILRAILQGLIVHTRSICYVGIYYVSGNIWSIEKMRIRTTPPTYALMELREAENE